MLLRIPGSFHKLALGPNTCRVYLGTNQTGVAATTTTKCNLDTVFSDPSNIFDAVNHRIKPKVAGTYAVFGRVYMTGASMVEAQALLEKNGSIFVYGNITAAAANEWLGQVSELVACNGTTDYIELFSWVNLPGTATFNSSSIFTTLSCVRVGP